jgi:hypothetical protein
MLTLRGLATIIPHALCDAFAAFLSILRLAKLKFLNYPNYREAC